MMTEGKKDFPVQDFKLDPDTELRFEIESKQKVILTLKSGFAEVFGTELLKGIPYEFTAGAKIAVYTWQGCSIELKGKTDVSYVAKETPMIVYCNCHAALESMRVEAERDGKRGPVALLVGPGDVGKSTLCRILLNYAVRIGRRPLYIDLDVGQGNISVPGTIGALLIERPASLDEGFAQEAPLVYSFGHNAPSFNVTLYNKLCDQLAQAVKEKLDQHKKTKVSGTIINTCGWVKREGYTFLTNAAKTFQVDVILVLDQERLYNELVRDMPSTVKVVLLPKSGGVVERSKSARAELRDLRIREYFYGVNKSIRPYSFDVKWSDVKLYKIGAPALPDSCLPLGMKAEDHLMKVVPVTPNPGLLHHLLAVSYAAKEDEEVINSHTAGFVCVTNVDVDRQTITVLSPQPKPLPNNILVLSEVQFMDD